jgi:hypothetical protein
VNQLVTQAMLELPITRKEARSPAHYYNAFVKVRSEDQNFAYYEATALFLFSVFSFFLFFFSFVFLSFYLVLFFFLNFFQVSSFLLKISIFTSRLSIL